MGNRERNPTLRSLGIVENLASVSASLAAQDEIAESPTYCCPEPVLLIVGGWAASAWEVGVYVSPRSRALTELIELVDGSVGSGGDSG